MRLKDGCFLKEIKDSYVIFPIQKSIDSTRTMFTTNEAGALLWHTLQKETTEDELVAVLMAHYEVDEATARRDVKIFVRELVDSNLIDKFP